MKAEVGSVIIGTLRSSDLVVAFMDALDALDAVRADHLLAEYGDAVAWALDNTSSIMEDDEPGDVAWLLEDLFDALDDLAPDGYYFGTLEGDGSDFGFWPLPDWLDEG